MENLSNTLKGIEMNRTILSAATAAVLSLSLLSAGAQAAENEMKMVHDTVAALLTELGLPNDNIDSLTMAQVSQIIAIADSHEMGDAAKVRVQKIIAGN